jgi:hypothetical protein
MIALNFGLTSGVLENAHCIIPLFGGRGMFFFFFGVGRLFEGFGERKPVLGAEGKPPQHQRELVICYFVFWVSRD